MPAYLKSAALSRKCDYLAGRHCAQQALKFFSKEPLFLNIANGITKWPINFIGSLSHANGVAVAAAAGRARQCKWVGIDLEQLVSDSEVNNLQSYVMSSGELDKIARYVATRSEAFTLIFSAKESIYKALYLMVQHFFDFKEAVLVSVDEVNFRLLFRISEKISSKVGEGEVIVDYASCDGYVVTWCVN